MDIGRKAVGWFKAGLVCAFLGAGLASCGGDDDDFDDDNNNNNPPPVTSTYIAAVLVSDGSLSGAPRDEFLINPWGLAFHPTGYAWVANNGTSTATAYDGNGVIRPELIDIPSGISADSNPTGIVFNSTTDFKVTQNGVTGPSQFIFVGEAGTISGWSQEVNATTAVTVFDRAFDGPVYKGVAIARNAGANFIYVADFRNNAIEVYNGNFARVGLGNFRDPGLPAGYAAYGIQAIGDRIYIAYARQALGGQDEIRGAGLGVVSVFNTNGTFIRQLVNGGALNAPWGMAIAPVNFGSFSGDLLVANFGDGKVNAYDPDNGKFQGTLTRPDGAPIVIDGLWGIAFGNGSFSQPLNTLFFTAGPSDETQGWYGRIDLQ